MNQSAERLLQHSNIISNQANTESVSENDTNVCRYTPSFSHSNLLANLNNTVVLIFYPTETCRRRPQIPSGPDVLDRLKSSSS